MATNRTSLGSGKRFMTGMLTSDLLFAAAGWRHRGGDSAPTAHVPKNQPEIATLAAKKTQPACCDAERASKRWNYR
jgi:hypothetical protein